MGGALRRTSAQLQRLTRSVSPDPSFSDAEDEEEKSVGRSTRKRPDPLPSGLGLDTTQSTLCSCGGLISPCPPLSGWSFHRKVRVWWKRWRERREDDGKRATSAKNPTTNSAEVHRQESHLGQGRGQVSFLYLKRHQPLCTGLLLFSAYQWPGKGHDPKTATNQQQSRSSVFTDCPIAWSLLILTEFRKKADAGRFTVAALYWSNSMSVCRFRVRGHRVRKSGQTVTKYTWETWSCLYYFILIHSIRKCGCSCLKIIWHF